MSNHHSSHLGHHPLRTLRTLAHPPVQSGGTRASQSPHLRSDQAHTRDTNGNTRVNAVLADTTPAPPNQAPSLTTSSCICHHLTHHDRHPKHTWYRSNNTEKGSWLLTMSLRVDLCWREMQP